MNAEIISIKEEGDGVILSVKCTPPPSSSWWTSTDFAGSFEDEMKVSDKADEIEDEIREYRRQCLRLHLGMIDLIQEK